MKKIKVKAQEKRPGGRGFIPVDFFHLYRRRITKVLSLAIIVIICVTLTWLWIRHREQEASLLLAQATGSADYREIAERFPRTSTNPLALIGLAKGLFGEGKYKESVSVYKEFINEYPQHTLIPAALIGLAYCYEELDQREDAKSIFLKIQHQFPDSVWVKEADTGYKRVSKRTSESS